jgi:phosphonoacetaldehyde hydrolase
MTEKLAHVKAVIFDWAGTTVDYGSRAPAIVFEEIFRRRGVPITSAQAREPMGMAKREHIAAIAAMPTVAKSWQAIHGRPIDSTAIDAMYEEFLPLQKSVLSEHSNLIPGVTDVAEQCRQMGIRIGSTTGYTRALMEIVCDCAMRQGYAPECVVCAEDAPRGRPAPFLLYEAAKRLDVYPLWNVIAVDDTEVGIRAARNAGCWAVGVTKTGNCVGLALDEIDALPRSTVLEMCDFGARRLRAAGAHYTVESVAEIVPIIRDIESWLAGRETPVSIVEG